MFNIPSKPVEPIRGSFSLYKGDIAELIGFIKDADSVSFDVDSDGYIWIYVAGKETKRL